MLGKLLKYDLKFGKNSFLGMAGALIGASISLKIADNTLFSKLSFAPLILVFGLPAAIISIVMVFQNYNKSLFGSQGYLMLTLPVKRGSLLASQVISAMIWFNFMTVTAMVTLLIVANANALPILNSLTVGQIQWVLLLTLLSNTWALMCIVTLFLAISFSNLSIKGKKLPGLVSGVLSFFFIYLQFELQDFISNRLGQLTLYIQFWDSRLTMSFNDEFANGFRSTTSINLTLLGCVLAFITINYGLNLYLLNRRVDIR